MSYLVVKQLHVTCAVLSGCGFLARGVAMARASPWLRRRWVGIVPHVIDSVLLASAVVLALMSAQYPFQQAWLTAKVLALVAYILLGTIALKRGRSRAVRLAAWVAAMAVFLYIVSVARARDARGFLVWLA